MQHLQAGRKPELDHLLGHAEGAEISACDAITVAAVAITTGRQQRPVRRQVEERVLDSLGSASSSALAEIVQDQARHGDALNQAMADRFLAEMAHVGIERFAPVTHSTTAPRMMKVMPGWCRMNSARGAD